MSEILVAAAVLMLFFVLTFYIQRRIDKKYNCQCDWHDID